MDLFSKCFLEREKRVLEAFMGSNAIVGKLFKGHIYVTTEPLKVSGQTVVSASGCQPCCLGPILVFADKHVFAPSVATFRPCAHVSCGDLPTVFTV